MVLKLVGFIEFGLVDQVIQLHQLHAHRIGALCHKRDLLLPNTTTSTPSKKKYRELLV
jgi:hypothetical protein